MAEADKDSFIVYKKMRNEEKVIEGRRQIDLGILA